jgi:hypothetical protein
MVGEVGFEPTTPASRTLCASQAALLPGPVGATHYNLIPKKCNPN